MIAGAAVEDESRSAGEILESINKLSKLRQFLRDQLKQCIVRKECAKDKNEIDKSGAELLDEIEETRSKITERKVKHMLQEEILEVLQYSDESQRAAYASQFPPHKEHPELSTEQRSRIRNSMLQLHELSKEISELKEQKLKLKRRNFELDKEIMEVVERNREAMALLQRKERNKQMNKPEMSQGDKERFASEVKRLRCVKHIFQNVIQATGVDIYEDEELRKLVIELGKAEHFS